MELLAPAGNMEALRAAVEAGADAVYLGGKYLNARRGAGNFDADELKRAADYCHERDVKVHVTVNTLIRDSEFGQLECLAKEIAAARADAAIVQDFGVAAALRQMLPGLALHASTQMAISNRQGVLFAKNAGFSRVVLAREMSAKEIRECADAGVEIEVFAHGAMCVAASGLCLLSSMIGGRSGNRGMCAQPCRLPWRLEGGPVSDAGALLSPKDLCLADRIPQLRSAGVDSIKLEGRLKGPEYVYAVTRAYRLALDGEAWDARALRGVFNRGYSTGYFDGLRDCDFLSDETEKHVEEQTGEADGRPVRARTVPVAAKLVLKPGEPALLEVSDGISRAKAEGAAVETARRVPADEERIASQILKTGSTPYRIAELRKEIAPDAFVPVSALNALRRDALSRLGALRIERNAGCGEAVRPLEPPAGLPKPETGDRPRLVVCARSARTLEASLDWGADEILWAPADWTEKGLGGAPKRPFWLLLPPVATGGDLDAIHRLVSRMDGLCGTVLSNAGQLALEWPGEKRLDAAMNIMNLRAQRAFGLPCMPSLEMTAREIGNLDGPKELWMYGRARLMLLRHCPLNARAGRGLHADCRRCERSNELEKEILTDRRGVAFPLRRVRLPSGCVIELLNSVPTLLLNKTERLPRAQRWRVTLTDEGEELARRAVKAHAAALSGKAEDLLNDISGTSGHCFRGVE
ncbi:MAG: U32 family peptidase [Clostridia bacterium]|nr:U32 family peptidase [Clostridia bacterium]